MTEYNIDEKLIVRFFEANRIGEIEDRGFSRRVMRQLPVSRMHRLNTLWTLLCTLIAVVYFFMHQGTRVLFVAFSHLWNNFFATLVMPEWNMTTALLTYIGVVLVMVFAVYHVLTNARRFI